MDTAIKYGIHILQLTGMLVVGVTALRLFYALAAHRFATHGVFLSGTRVRYVQGLLLAFDILVAAGILTTILHPSWSDIGKLAAIAALRTLIKKALNIGIGQGMSKAPVDERSS